MKNADVYVNGTFLNYLEKNYPQLYQAIRSFLLVPNPDPGPGLRIVAETTGNLPLPARASLASESPFSKIL